MQLLRTKKRWWLLAAGAAAAAGVWWGRALIWLAAKLLFLGAVTALAALPVMKRLEKRLPAGLSAALAIAALNAVLAAALFLLVPAIIRQVRQLTALLPGLWNSAEMLITQAQEWLMQRGVTFLNTDAQSALLLRMQESLGKAVPAVVGRLGGIAGDVGQWMLAPVFGFYFLRDRQMLSRHALDILPANWRAAAVHMLREMRRETAGYLRGQLLISAVVGGMTAAGLLLCGVPSWLALGAAIGILELIPYAGPVIGAALAVLFALPLGVWRAVWALGVVIAVQQVDSSILSPRLISQTTRLHPAAVILLVVLGGAAAGVAGVLLVIPAVLCIRVVLRVLLMQRPMHE